MALSLSVVDSAWKSSLGTAKRPGLDWTQTGQDRKLINPQRVILTRWGPSLPFHLRRQPHQPPTSHFDSLEALSPLPPATPATSTPPPATPATSTPNESLRLVGGSLSPSTCDYNRVFIIIKYKDLLLRF